MRYRNLESNEDGLVNFFDQVVALRDRLNACDLLSGCDTHISEPYSGNIGCSLETMCVYQKEGDKTMARIKKMLTIHTMFALPKNLLMLPGEHWILIPTQDLQR